MLRSGRLRHTCSLQVNTPTQGANGELAASWSNVTTGIFCEVLNVGGGETIRGRQVSATATHVITMHYRAGITPKHRLVLATGEVLGIERAEDPTGRREELVCQCVEVTDG